MLTLYVRQDLKMRKGKMAAQCAHAAMKLFFDVMLKQPTKMVLLKQQKEELMHFFANAVINVVMVQDDGALHAALDSSKPYATIIDSGRTEFHGVPTLTCAAQGVFTSCPVSEINVPAMYGKDIKAKQIFVFNKDLPLTKENACKLSVLTCLELLYQKMQSSGEDLYFDITQESAFIDWITHAFAKIALSTKTLEELNVVADNLSNEGIYFIKKKIGDNTCLCIEPCYPQQIDLITGQLTLI